MRSTLTDQHPQPKTRRVFHPQMPSSSLMRMFSKLEVDFALACLGDVDADCAR